MTWVIYAYHPRNLKDLTRLIAHEIVGPEARWRMHVARVLRVIASKATLDTSQSPTYADELENVYVNPFREREPEIRTKEEICNDLLERLKE